MKKLMTALALATMGATIGLAGAAQADPPANLRQLNQERRIDAGVRSGKLSPHEAASLRGQQHAISDEKQAMKARHHGHLTARDKRILHARQNHANRMILHKKHNRVRGKDHLKI